MRTYTLKPLTLAIIAMLASGQLHAQQTSELSKITVTGEGDKLGTGLLVDEDTPKAKSTVTKAQLDKTRSSSNAFQDLNLLPGVNASSTDPTGMSGGNLRVRGFNSDQMGFTVDGAPVNDSGNFAVYPQELTDKENMCDLFVTQGGTDAEAPHVGASGGNIGMNSCGPTKEMRLRVAQSFGQLDYLRSYVRVDTGEIGKFKGYLSYSKSSVDKWKGEGENNRQHIDSKLEYDLGKGSRLSMGMLANELMNHNYRSMTLAEIEAEGYKADYSGDMPKHVTPVNGTAQTESAGTVNYYDYARNPFKNYLLTPKANLQVGERTRLDIEPYYWYGYGGSTYPTTITESKSSSNVHGGVSDINGDTDVRDRVLVLTGSMTETNRPGINVKATHDLDNHKITTGLWFERARHRQTRPATYVDNSGTVLDWWLDDSDALIKYQDGNPYQARDWLTISTGKSAFLQDTIDLMDSRLQITPSVTYKVLQRDFRNFSNNGTASTSATSAAGNGYLDYRVVEKYQQVQPGLGTSFNITDKVQTFFGVANNFRAPSNSDYANLIRTYSGNTITSMYDVPVKQEKSTNYDLGTRFKGDWGKASVTAFFVDFRDRIASSYDPTQGYSHSWNVGDSTTHGLELEGGSAPYHGFSVYGSFSYTLSKMKENMPSGSTTYYATAGKQFPDTPKYLASLSLQYAYGPYMANLAAKYTGERYLTLVNDVSIPSYTLLDLNTAWSMPFNGVWGFKNPTLRFNISNLTNKKYYVANAGSGSNVTISNDVAAPKVYTGAGRFASMTFQVDY
ncbi:TonB-dependent receptor [Uliginosibacterium sp. 31-12]|uniref:TonB-dependent receptor n=1 Tax=Uliginosibacterium sp. 31-12 TaxID=3062781 RepID=UPI0026E424C2|nr:TonB-dependent receptor [Uliginosibacterium sp. 31-12]MDO6387712.1 TonB-dependent receptor [Uliginosibacterium sp. 31-12]